MSAWSEVDFGEGPKTVLDLVQRWVASSFSADEVAVERSRYDLAFRPARVGAASLSFMMEGDDRFVVSLEGQSMELDLSANEALAITFAVAEGRCDQTLGYRRGEVVSAISRIVLEHAKPIVYNRAWWPAWGGTSKAFVNRALHRKGREQDPER